MYMCNISNNGPTAVRTDRFTMARVCRIPSAIVGQLEEHEGDRELEREMRDAGVDLEAEAEGAGSQGRGRGRSSPASGGEAGPSPLQSLAARATASAVPAEVTDLAEHAVEASRPSTRKAPTQRSRS